MRLLVLCCALAGCVLSGCGPSGPGTPSGAGEAADRTDSTRSDELRDAGGRPCPASLPLGDDPSGLGFGVEEPADEVPAIAPPDGAWVCRYASVGAGGTPSGGTRLAWEHVGPARPVPDRALPDLGAALGELTVPGGDGCNDDLGPRWMVVLDRGGDLTGAVVDDYGCREVRLTGDPHVVPPGAADQPGTVGGVLHGGAAVLDALDLAR